jgi:hypothetical protein
MKLFGWEIKCLLDEINVFIHAFGKVGIENLTQNLLLILGIQMKKGENPNRIFPIGFKTGLN